MSHLEQDRVSTETGRNSTQRLRAFLRLRHPRKTAESVAADTGVAVGTVAAWLKGISAPSFPAFEALIDAYDVDVLAAVLPDNVAIAEMRLDAERRRMSRDLAALAAELEARR